MIGRPRDSLNSNPDFNQSSSSHLNIIRNLALLACCAVLFVACGGGDSESDPAYTVGGSISGLNGTVVLQNNGGNSLSLNSNGSFSFSSPISAGATYLVSVLTQPAGQTCSASNHQGVMSSGNVTGVTVVCINNAPGTRTIGGSITGLTGTIVLQNNAQDNLTRSANGNFTFATPIQSGLAYSVTVLTQPAGQTCAVANGTGTAGSTNVTSISVTCTNGTGGAPLTWQGPAALSTGSSSYFPLSPRVAINGQGTAFVVWRHQYNGTKTTIKYAKLSGNTWTTDQTIAALNVPVFDEPRVAVDEEGNAVAIWGQAGQIYASYYTAGASWSTPQAISIPGAVVPSHHGLGFTTSGTAIVLSFVEGDGVYAIQRLKSSGWQAPQKLGAQGDDASGLQLVFHSGDSATAIWADPILGPHELLQVKKRTYSSGTWAAAESSALPSGFTFFSEENGAAGDAAGNLIVLGSGSITENGSTSYRGGALRYTAGSGWGDSLTPLGSNQTPNLIESNANGNAVVTLSDEEVVYFNTGSGWTAPTRLTGSARSSALGIDAAGNAFVTWESSGSADGGVLASRYNFASGIWSLGASIDGGTGYNTTQDSAVSANGTAVTAWIRVTDGPDVVYANFFR